MHVHTVHGAMLSKFSRNDYMPASWHFLERREGKNLIGWVVSDVNDSLKHDCFIEFKTRGDNRVC